MCHIQSIAAAYLQYSEAIKWLVSRRVSDGRTFSVEVSYRVVN